MGTYKAYFRGKPEDYWETTYFDFFSAITAMLLLIGFFIGLTVLVVDWSLYWGTESYVIASSAATAVFIVIFLIMNYFLSRGKKKK